MNKSPDNWHQVYDGSINFHNYDEAIRLIICAKYGYGNNVADLRMAMEFIQDEIRKLEGQPDPELKDINQHGGKDV